MLSGTCGPGPESNVTRLPGITLHAFGETGWLHAGSEQVDTWFLASFLNMPVGDQGCVRAQIEWGLQPLRILQGLKDFRIVACFKVDFDMALHLLICNTNTLVALV